MLFFGKRLRELRKERNLSQIELAKKMNTTSQAISQYELNKRTPDMKMINKLADFFDVSVDYLLGRTDQRNPNVDLPEGVKELLSEEEQEFIIELIQKEDFHMFLREARGASDEDLATAVRVFKAVKEGKEKGEQL